MRPLRTHRRLLGLIRVVRRTFSARAVDRAVVRLFLPAWSCGVFRRSGPRRRSRLRSDCLASRALWRTRLGRRRVGVRRVRGSFAPLRERRFEFRHPLPRAPELAQVLSCPRFGFVEAGEGIARDRLMARPAHAALHTLSTRALTDREGFSLVDATPPPLRCACPRLARARRIPSTVSTPARGHWASHPQCGADSRDGRCDPAVGERLGRLGYAPPQALRTPWRCPLHRQGSVWRRQRPPT
jgi:hypothetical protein